MILMIDNYDSFTYNIVQYLGELGELVEVFRNDEISLAEIEAMAPQGIVISPGPCTPNEAGISMEVIRTFAGKIPILGICLGHQSIGQVYGGVVGRAKKVMHGKTSAIHHTGLGVFAGLPNPFTATRYHSLVVESESLPDCLEVTAWTQVDGVIDEIMGVRHKSLLIEGVQFHPESILTEHGHKLLQSFVDTCGQNDSLPSAQTTRAPAKLMEDSR
ncbi:MAG: anthranilate synthase component 2 [Cyclobacteriaceae bacterium]|jgi:anthranilate synthase component 2